MREVLQLTSIFANVVGKVFWNGSTIMNSGRREYIEKKNTN